MSLIEHIKEEEGFRGTPYKDTLGYLTIGYGTKLPLDEAEAELLLIHRLKKMQKQLHRRITELYGEVQLPDKVWEILYHMSYQLGVQGVMNFKKMLRAIVNGNYIEASREMLDSKWALQTPNRAERLSTMMGNIK
jgi:lysozyme